MTERENHEPAVNCQLENGLPMRKPGKGDTIGLALGGGAVLGAAHVGVLRALEELGLPVSFVAGTSVGAFIAALFAFNKNWQQIGKLVLDLNWLDVSGISLSQSGLLSNEKMGQLIRDAIGDVSFARADIPLAMVAADISTGEKVVIREGDVATAVMASTCIPGVFVPVEAEDRLLVDGGIVENVPVESLKEMGADFVIGVDLHAKHSHSRPENIVEVLLNTLDFAIMTATKLQTSEADILITPDLMSFNSLNPGQTADIMEVGYREAMAVLRDFG